jgi:hypothetical protein
MAVGHYTLSERAVNGALMLVNVCEDSKVL